jgi:hypothetical protein
MVLRNEKTREEGISKGHEETLGVDIKCSLILCLPSKHKALSSNSRTVKKKSSLILMW